MNDKVFICSLKGWKGSGKTTLLCGIASSSPVQPVGAVKIYSGTLNPDGGDSWRLKQSHAAEVYLIHKDSSASIASIDALLGQCPGLRRCRMILCEGIILPGFSSGVLYDKDTVSQGLKEGHHQAGLLIHDGDAETLAFLSRHRNSSQQLVHRDQLDVIIKHIVRSKPYGSTDGTGLRRQ